MKGRFEWWFGCLEGFKAPRSLESVVGNPNYGSPATSFASLAPLCVARLLFQYILATNLPLRWQFHRLHGKLLTGDMSVGMRWLFMAWGGGVLNAWWVGEGCSMPHCSFSPQCQCRHKSHEFLQQYVSEAQNLQLIETKPTQFWEPFDPRLRDSCNMKMLWNGQQAQTPRVFLVCSWRQGRCGARPWRCSDIPRALP